ncbi:hypothetical protein [Salibacterium lacus]|uniref:Uncharacterized protein n=1 Tax=Salibacterium lacus TaxID=1898109 RepID=A0ABW5T3F4_9BACI
MAKRNVSRSSIPVKPGKNEMTVRLRNDSVNHQTRQLHINAFDKDDDQKEPLPIYHDGQKTNSVVLTPEQGKLYTIDATGVKRKVVFEAVQTKGGKGLSVKSKNAGNVNAEIRIK